MNKETFYIYLNSFKHLHSYQQNEVRKICFEVGAEEITDSFGKTSFVFDDSVFDKLDHKFRPYLTLGNKLLLIK